MNQGHNLVSQYQIKDRYKIIEISGDCFILEPRQKGSGLRAWEFSRDEERYGDLLLHCTVPRQMFVQALQYAQDEVYSVYRDRAYFNESNLSRAEMSALDRVSLLHEDLNHASPEAMIRTVKS